MDHGASNYRRFLEGDEQGLAEMIKDYKDGLIFFLVGFVGDIHTAEDLTEDTFVKLVTKKPRYSSHASFKTWLYTIARNVALAHLRKNKRSPEIAIADDLLSTDEESLERTYIREEQKIAVHRALRKLKSEYRQILWLIYFEDLSNKEAARIMKKSVHNIETLVYRARQSLKSALEKEGFIDEEFC